MKQICAFVQLFDFQSFWHLKPVNNITVLVFLCCTIQALNILNALIGYKNTDIVTIKHIHLEF